MLRMKIDRDAIARAIEHHVDNEGRLRPVIESDGDLEDWALYILAKLSAIDISEIREDAGLIISATDEGVLLCLAVNKAGDDVMDAIKHYLL